MVRQWKLVGLGHAASKTTRALFRLVRRALSSLGVWMLPLIVAAIVAAALSGSLTLHGGAGPNPDQEKPAAAGENPFMTVDLYYPAEYINVVKAAQQERQDILASFSGFRSAWSAASPETHFAIKVVTCSIPNPIKGVAASPVLTATEVADESTFEGLRGLLEDLRSVILEGDGSGCGRLERSGYEAHPADQDTISPPEARDQTGAGPAKHLLLPATTF